MDTKLAQYDDVIQRGAIIKEEINGQSKRLEIEVDGAYQSLLLLEKKNYAGASSIMINGGLVKEVGTKDLYSVRRERAVIAKETCERIAVTLWAGAGLF